ncbi:MAG: GIY-YIG nuclease family protein [Desulfobacterales bacterium]|nr:GIY-YIG nuclease family protein [Desulfobacterales bacterium]
MSFFIYILKSESTDRYHCGFTSNVERRVKQHNDPEYQGSLDSDSGDWKLVYTEEFETLGNAVSRERQIKKRGVKRFLEQARSSESRRRRD